ncbi:MAG TPA: hypothetical protein VM074_12775 [Solimonas sp.]|nr:hypothetical protein [Solimonas sp.]
MLAVIAGAAWLFWPSPSTSGPSVTARAKATAPVDPNALSAKLISSEDLPPEGTRSLFDHLIAQNESLPYPFEKLVALVRRQDPDARPPVALMVPFGRSLLKAQADFVHPRVLVAADFEGADGASLGLRARGALFLGFVENAGEIEVISYNEAAGRYEFQLVQDYRPDGKPRIVYAKRAVCTTCHQGAAPIFPQRPWNETNGQPEIKQKIVEARGEAPYLGVPALNELQVPERFDQLTDVANFIPPTQRVWIDGCADGESGAQCRRLLLKLALRYAWNPGAFDAAGADAEKLRALQAAHWPAGGIAVPESDLRNRDPLAERHTVSGRVRETLAALLPHRKQQAEPKSNEDLEAFERLPRLPAELDPLTPRPPKRVLTAQDIDGVFGLASMFTAADVRLLAQAAKQDWPRVEAAVDALPAAFLQPAPFSRVRSVQALLGGGLAAKRAPVPAYCCLDTAEMSPPIALGEPALALALASPLKPFEDYCFACHRGNPSKRLNFMGGKTEAEVLEHVQAKPEIRDALDWPRYRGTAKENKLMPPADSAQRARLEQALAQDPKLLETMRAVVPGLFDF